MPPENSSSNAPAKDMSALYIPVSIVVAGLIIGGGIFLGLSGFGGVGSVPSTGGSPQREVNVKDVNLKDAAFVGKANAPLVMAYWSDYQCPFCKQFEDAVLPTLMEKYVTTGKLKIFFMDFAFLGPDSTTAALYKRAVWELYPAKFFEWNEAMYAAQDQEHGGFGDEASIVKLSATISGIDAKKLKAQVAAKTAAYQKMIDADQQEGGSFGIQGTPGFIIGKQSIDGAQPLENFIAAIDSQLK
jgi:protein-disulfide isomerase